MRRPVYQVDITVKTSAPVTSGNQPPSATLMTFAPKNARSMIRNGTAIFMSRNSDGIPTTLLHNIKHNKIVHKTVVLLTVESEERSYLSEEERFEWADLGHGVYRLALHFGFMEDPDIPATLEKIDIQSVSFNPMTTSYFLGRETLIPTKQPGMAIWREHMFAWMTRNASSASGFFNLPPNQVIELGAQVEL